MHLLIDIGNTACKVVTENKGLLSDIQQMSIPALILFIQTQRCNLVSVVICSVGNKHDLAKITDVLTDQATKFQILHSEESRFGLKNSYSDYNQLGDDRWVAMIGARNVKPKGSFIVVDAGTATTIDLVDANSYFVGGWILPGLKLMAESLLTTSNINVDIDINCQLSPGQSTKTNVENGSLLATIGGVNQAISYCQEKFGPIEHVFLTGGNAEILVPYINSPIILEQKLIFLGMRCYLLTESR